MTTTPPENPRFPEGINASKEHPLKEFFQLLVGISLALVVAVAAVGFAIGLAAPHIPFKWELAFAPALTNFIENDSKPASGSDRQASLVELGEKLVRASGDTGIAQEHFSFHLIDADVANAYATLGGHIVVTDKLIQAVSSENGLAMVLAHEIAHIQLRHPIEAASRSVLIQLLLTVVTGSTGEQLPGGILSGTSALTLLGFSRDMEAEADQHALTILRNHYGHVAGAAEFFQTLEREQSSTRWLEFAQTHPNAGKRLEVIQRAIDTNSNTGQLTPLDPHLGVKN